MTLGRCLLSIFCSRGTPPYHHVLELCSPVLASENNATMTKVDGLVPESSTFPVVLFRFACPEDLETALNSVFLCSALNSVFGVVTPPQFGAIQSHKNTNVVVKTQSKVIAQ